MKLQLSRLVIYSLLGSTGLTSQRYSPPQASDSPDKGTIFPPAISCDGVSTTNDCTPGSVDHTPEL